MLLSLAFLDVCDSEWDNAGLRCLLGSNRFGITKLTTLDVRGLVVCVEEFDQDCYRVLPEDAEGEIIAQMTLIVERLSLPSS